MFKDNFIRKYLFGRYFSIENNGKNSKTFRFGYSTRNNNYMDKEFIIRTDDGFIQTLLEKIDKLEERIEKLEVKKVQ